MCDSEVSIKLPKDKKPFIGAYVDSLQKVMEQFSDGPIYTEMQINGHTIPAELHLQSVGFSLKLVMVPVGEEPKESF